MIATLKYRISTRHLKPFLSTVIWKVKNRTHTHAQCTHTWTATKKHISRGFTLFYEFSNYFIWYYYQSILIVISRFFSTKKSVLSEEAKLGYQWFLNYTNRNSDKYQLLVLWLEKGNYCRKKQIRDVDLKIYTVNFSSGTLALNRLTGLVNVINSASTK